MKRTCKICEKGNLEEVRDIILNIENYNFVVSGHRCNECKEEFPLNEETEKVINVSKKLGIWSKKIASNIIQT